MSLTGNYILHGAMTDAGGAESVSDATIKAFINLAGKGLATCYFSDKWALSGCTFPTAKAQICKANGAVPFIRMQNSEDLNGKNGTSGKWAHSKIVAGTIDNLLNKWAIDCRAFGSPVIIEYGTEINGLWFSWSADEPPGNFIAAFRHIFKIFKNNNVTNARFAFHCDATDNNNSHKWYPGDDVVDWVGTSCYGGQGTGLNGIQSLATCYNDLLSLTKTRRVGIFEWGLPDPKDATDMLTGLPTKFPKIRMLQRWHEGVVPGHPEDTLGSGMINTSPALLKAYQTGIANQVYKAVYPRP